MEAGAFGGGLGSVLGLYGFEGAAGSFEDDVEAGLFGGGFASLGCWVVLELGSGADGAVIIVEVRSN